MKETDEQLDRLIENSLNKIKELMQWMYHENGSKVCHISEDFKKRKLIISKIAGEYERPDGWMFALEGTPVRGKLYISNVYSNHSYCKSGATWRPIQGKKKYLDLSIVISAWKEYREEKENREWQKNNA